jgi:hypothetical protein
MVKRPGAVAKFTDFGGGASWRLPGTWSIMCILVQRASILPLAFCHALLVPVRLLVWLPWHGGTIKLATMALAALCRSAPCLEGCLDRMDPIALRLCHPDSQLFKINLQ